MAPRRVGSPSGGSPGGILCRAATCFPASVSEAVFWTDLHLCRLQVAALSAASEWLRLHEPMTRRRFNDTHGTLIDGTTSSLIGQRSLRLA